MPNGIPRITPDGQWLATAGSLWFEGPEAPISGLKLVSSPWPDMEAEEKDPSAKRSKTLKRFSWLRGASYCLAQMSPCKRYAFVRQDEQFWRKSDELAMISTYFVVEASTGKTRVLLKDEVARKTGGSSSLIWWVRSSGQ
jgi:hypothetical protein